MQQETWEVATLQCFIQIYCVDIADYVIKEGVMVVNTISEQI